MTPLTDLNLAYVNFDENFTLTSPSRDLLLRASFLKMKHPGLRVAMSIGGHGFSYGPTSGYWSDMVSTEATRRTFIHSVVDFLVEYGFNGVDLDWEYPSASEMGGRQSDASNFVQLLAEMRGYFNSRNPGWTITASIPTSSEYLQGFNIEGMGEYISWFNLMPFDRRWVYSKEKNSPVPYLQGHTDISEVETALQILRHSHISMDKVVMGMAFQGRAHTLEDVDCWQPEGVCRFMAEDVPISCSDAEGLLTYAEVIARNGSTEAQVHYNSTTTVKYKVIEGDEWISYDDEESWRDKKSFLSENCLSGLFIWSLDQDSGQFDAMSRLMGDFSNLQLKGGGASPSQPVSSSHDLSSFTGQNCFVTPRCTDSTDGELGPEQPPTSSKLENGGSGFSCNCRNDKLPVDPEKLWKIDKTNSAEQSDALWSYSTQPSNNDSEDEGESLDPDEDSFDTYTIVRKQRQIPRVKRSALTSNQTILDSVFDHSEEILHIYCNYSPGSEECDRIWLDGAEDTIINLPMHVGEGPFARLVSIQAAHKDFELPSHHLEHRSLEGLSDPVYEMKIDYNFHAIKLKRDSEPVHIRIDHSNLAGYRDEMMGAEPMRKRNADETPKRHPDWHARVNKAVARDNTLRKRSTLVNVTVPMSNKQETGQHDLNKRWWGSFGSWHSKLNMVKKSTLRVLPLAWADTINLFREQKGCVGSGSSASLEIDLEASVNMDITYAYYFSGTIIPPNIPDAYAYLAMQPRAYVGLSISGQAEMQYTSERAKIIPTITYPGLAIKGLASIGPSLDIYGQIVGKITISGKARAGAHFDFGKTEVYWPQNDESSSKYQKLLGIESNPSVPDQGTLKPVFEADVELDAALDVTSDLVGLDWTGFRGRIQSSPMHSAEDSRTANANPILKWISSR
ncbi:glycosyl hydrolases family 18 domain-containing protein [Hirsutella rhossiliensis]|uniref:chitinase n=1 Tax=Hirsutella rhossiliensis TaxID=111463 RepID=A0A9P8N7Y2_9HYPO|nr:glycosyl hydrolases family 18 domain-containing protein [Hirsutella rhossiliensis]KAH0968485.1 glycosyl hydrolases family 18 domain-containing protein [Hirsutella rhossiliensis]